MWLVERRGAQTVSEEQSLSGTQGVLQGGLPGCGHSPRGVQEPLASGRRGGLGAGAGGGTWQVSHFSAVLFFFKFFGGGFQNYMIAEANKRGLDLG